MRRADAQAEQTLERERRLQELKLRPSPEKPLESQPEHTDGKKLSRENELSLRNTEVSILRRENEALKRERDRLRADLKESEAKEKVQLIRENDQLRTVRKSTGFLSGPASLAAPPDFSWGHVRQRDVSPT